MHVTLRLNACESGEHSLLPRLSHGCISPDDPAHSSAPAKTRLKVGCPSQLIRKTWLQMKFSTQNFFLTPNIDIL
eukprot:969019-Amphidinium_carterae.2